MPVRTIPKSYRNVTGIAASTKSVGAAQFESPLERDFIALLEFSPDVVRYEVQPVTIDWMDPQGKVRSYTPDVLVEFIPELKRPPWLCEIKYRSTLQKEWPELRPRFRQSIRYAKAKGWRFHLVSEIEIRTPYLANVRFLQPYRERSAPDSSIAIILQALAHQPAGTVAELLNALSSDPYQQAELLPTVWHLVANFRIGVDLDSPLNMDSLLWSLQ